MDVNRRIAELCNNGDLTYAQIADQMNLEFDLGLSRVAVRNRIQRMRENGTLDYTKTLPGSENILDEIEKEACGGFFKVGILDIETTGLWADFGYVLVAVIKDLDNNSHEIFRLDKTKYYQTIRSKPTPENWKMVDREILQQIRAAYETYDLIIHFNGRNFDIKFLNTRLIKCGLPILPEMKQLDIYQLAKHKTRLKSKRLDALKEFLDIDREEDGHRWEYWQMAGAGMTEGFDFVTKHCIRDVDRLAEVAKRLKIFINYIKK